MKKKYFSRALSLMIAAMIALSLVVFVSPVEVLAETYPEQEGINNTSPTAAGRVIDKSVYMDKTKPIEVRIKALLDQMTLTEKVGQMTQLERPSNANARTYYIGSVLSGGGSVPSTSFGLSVANGGDGTGNTVSGWLDSYDQWQTEMANTPLGIPILYEIDAVHGTVHAPGTTVFPHAAGAASGGPEIMEDIGRAVAGEMRALELFASFSPCIPMGQNPRWGRYHEGWGHDYERNGIFGNSYSMGFQGGKPDKWDGLDTGLPGDKNQYDFLGGGAQVLGTMKHFTTEGETVNGGNAGNGFYYNPNFPIVCYGAYPNPLSMEQLANMKALKELTPAQLKADPEVGKMLNSYRIMVEGGARSIMPSYNYFNGLRMHEFKSMLDVIKLPVSEGGFGFTGFVVSDYNSGHADPYGPSAAANIQAYMQFFYGRSTHFDNSAFTQREVRIAAYVNAGGDMDMAVTTTGWCADLIKLVRSGIVPISRIDDAVTRILRVKFELGLFDRPTLVKAEAGATRNAQLAAATTKARAQLRKPETVALARRAVRESMLLLKNKDKVMETLKDVPGNKIMVTGRFANNIGWQLGGWTRVWQGESSTNHTFYAGETLLEAMQIVKPDGNFGTNGSGTGAQFNITGARNSGDTNAYDVVLVTVGETAYAEGNGDTNLLTAGPLGSIISHSMQLHPTDYATLQNAKANYPGAKIIMVSYSARPIVLDNVIDDVDAYVQVWWPGTEGLGMTDILFGDYDFTGKTAFPWYWFPEWIGFNDDVSKPYMFNIGAGLKKNEEFNAATPIPVKPSGDLRQGPPIVIRPTGTSSIDGRIYTWVANASNSISSPNLNAHPFKPIYYQPIYGKSGLFASTIITTPTTANWCGDAWVEYKISVSRPGVYNVNFTRTGSGTNADAVRILVDGVQKASYTVTAMATAQPVELEAGVHILRLAFSSSAASITVNSINISAPGDLPPVSTDVDTLVAGFNANINVSGATGTRAELRSGADVIASANIVGGSAKLAVSKDKATVGTYFLLVYDGDVSVASKEITIVTLPANVFKMSVETESNMVKAYFNAPIALDLGSFDVKLDGVSVGGTLEADGRTILFSDANASDYLGDEAVIITGVRLPGLFPDYVFTFKGFLTKK